MREEVLPLYQKIVPSNDALLLDNVLNSGYAIAAPLSQSSPETASQPVSEDFFALSQLSSRQYNTFFTQVINDLVRLYSASNFNDLNLSSLENLGVADLSSIATNLDKLDDRITAYQDLQLGFSKGYNSYHRTSFIDSSAVETDPQVLGGPATTSYDPRRQAIVLGVSSDHDRLHDTSGVPIVDVSLDLQIGWPMKDYEQFRSPNHAVDGSDASYWGEVVLTDSPINVPWPPPQPPAADMTLRGEWWQTTTFPAGGGRIAELSNDISFDGPINVASPGFPSFPGGMNPIPGAISATGFYVRWTGFITPTTSGLYTLGFNAQGGANLWVNSELLINVLSNNQTAAGYLHYSNSATLELQAGLLYAITVEWQVTSGSAYAMQLLWTLPGSTSPQLVPATVMSSDLTQKCYLPAVSRGLLAPITSGAVCEFTINFRQPQTFNNISLKPFCEFPINLAGICVVKRDPPEVLGTEVQLDHIKDGFHRYLVTEYSSKRENGYSFLNQTERLILPLQEDCLSLTLVVHQPHYTKEIFRLPAHQNEQQNLWQQMLGNTPLLGLPSPSYDQSLAQSYGPGADITYDKSPLEIITKAAQSIGSQMHSSLTSQDNPITDYTRNQYIYGLQKVEVIDRRYIQQGTFVSRPLVSNLNLAQGALVADEDLPMVEATVAPSGTWLGDLTLMPKTWSVPAAVISYDMTFGSGQRWYPIAPLDATMVHEAFLPLSQTTQTPLRMQAKPGTPVYLTSFDGYGNATLLGAVSAPPLNGSQPTVITSWSAFIQGPGFYVLSYTPMDIAKAVNFTDFDALEVGSVRQIVVPVPTSADQPTLTDRYQSIQLPQTPYIASAQIGDGFEPNGNPSSEYVPISVSIDNFPNQFPDQNDLSQPPSLISSYIQDTKHLTDLVQVFAVNQEVLYATTDPNPNAVETFQAQHSNWDTSGARYPQLFQIPSSGPMVPIPQYPYGPGTNPEWTADPTTGTITFANGNAAVSGQVAVSYWYIGNKVIHPVIVNRTDYITGNNIALTTFDPQSYPVIEYVQVGNRLYFNTPLPTSATVTINYHRLFDSIRMRATLTRVDPTNQSATPTLYGYTIFARDANITSDPVPDFPAVVWQGLELLYLGASTQINPLVFYLTDIVNMAANTALLGFGGLRRPVSVQNSSTQLAQQATIRWYKVVNTGSTTDYLRCSIAGQPQGTLVYWDINGDRFIEPDNGDTNGTNYLLLATDGSNYITVPAGGSVIVGITNPTGGPGSIVPATIYSAHPQSSYVDSQNWLLQNPAVDQNNSGAKLVIS